MNQTGFIYLADDEKEIRDLIKSFLEGAGHRVLAFENGEKLLSAFGEQAADLVILDVMMPGKDGFTICKELREISSVPIVLLTAKDADTDYIVGFGCGCDDYFTKPFSPVKLMMRVNAILKREGIEKKNEIERLSLGNLSLEIPSKRCQIGDRELKLTRIEWDLLYYLLERRKQAVSRNELLDEIWGYSADVETRVTDDTIKRLRKKMATERANVVIETVWGFGFRLDLKENEA